MKRLKRIFSIVLVLILTVSISAIPASATMSEFRASISNFPTRSTAYSNTFDGYTCVIQRMMWAHDTDNDDEGARAYIEAGGGVDGYYGKLTKLAVEVFQAYYGLEIDGKTGPATWTKIASLLSGRTVKPETFLTYNGYEIMKVRASYADIDLNYIYYYYTGEETAKVGYVFYTE